MFNRKANGGNIRILSFNQTVSEYSLLCVYIWKTKTMLLSVCCLLTCSLEKCSYKLTSLEKLKWESINVWYIMVISGHIHSGWVQIMSHCVSLILCAVRVSHLTQKPQCPPPEVIWWRSNFNAKNAHRKSIFRHFFSGTNHLHHNCTQSHICSPHPDSPQSSLGFSLSYLLLKKWCWELHR